MAQRVHIIGAGLAGLSAAVRLAQSGCEVTVHESAKHAGGRCRSYHDEALGTTIDNGTHLLLSGNREALAYLDLIGGRRNMVKAERAAFPFYDFTTGRRWRVDMGAGEGLLPLLSWLSQSHRRPPGLGPLGALKDVWRLARGKGKTVAACLDPGSERCRTFWKPLCVGVMNAGPDTAAAELLWRVLRETALKGGMHTKPMFAPLGLGAALVDPALEVLKSHGATVHFARRITSLDILDGLVQGVNFANAAEVLGDRDAVVLAVPHTHVAELLDTVMAPTESRAILNVHYRLSQPVETDPLVGLLGGHGEWIHRRGDVVSVTISGADEWMDKDTDAIAHALWPEVAEALALGDSAIGLPRYRVIKERRATFAATVEAVRQRPGTRTEIANLFLAGDWTDTGLPATIEGAVKSGRLAAEAVLKARG